MTPRKWRYEYGITTRYDVIKKKLLVTMPGHFGVDIDRYDVIDAKGQKVGTVTHTASTSIWPPQWTSHSLVQRDIDGTVVVDTHW